MDYIREIIKKTKYFLIPYSILLSLCIILLLVFSKSQIHLWSNKNNTPLLDTFFAHITFCGDGIFVILVALCLLFYRVGHSILVMSTYALTGIIVQVLKKIFFAGAPRPKLYFQGLYDLYFVQGVNVHSINSFPSGHSASAFALFFCLALITRYQILRIAFLVLAIFVAYSRIYLSQHFLVDVVVGSLIGIIIVIVYYYFHKKIKGEWINKPLTMQVFKANKHK